MENVFEREKRRNSLIFGMRYHIITFGCQMNKSDSERIAASLEKKGYKSASKIDEADLIIVNMCSVRQSAVDRVFGLSRKFTGFKAKKILTGCILKKDRARLRKIFDAVWPSSAKATEGKEKLSIPSKFIPISTGCSNFCTYCVVPYTRGALLCRSHQEILKEVKRAVRSGVKEIWLLGQNVNDYRSPIDPSINFPKLLKMVSDIPGDFSVRFLSSNPKDFSDELIDVIAREEKISKYLNLPIQSGNDKILRAMNRLYTAQKYKDLVKKIRKKIPNVNLATDIIVGFPGETKSQFENTKALVKEIGFDVAFIAKYSARPGTVAFKLKDNVPLIEKKRREKILQEIIKK